MKKLEKIKIEYENICAKYIALFEKKQDLCFECWIGDVGNIACFGDVFIFNLSDIILDLETKQKKGLIINHVYDNLDNQENFINYKSYTMGLRHKDL